MITKTLIENFRETVKPVVSQLLFGVNYEGMGTLDCEEFERDFDEILDLALAGYEQKVNNAVSTLDGNKNDMVYRQAAIDALDCINGTEEVLRSLPPAQPEPQWISVTERLPDNADHPGAFCPRYQVVTPYGVTEGWYRPHDHEKGGQWFALFWFMSQTYEIWNIDFERGDVPKVIGEAPVMEWRPLPEPYKPNK